MAADLSEEALKAREWQRTLVSGPEWAELSEEALKAIVPGVVALGRCPQQRAIIRLTAARSDVGERCRVMLGEVPGHVGW